MGGTGVPPIFILRASSLCVGLAYLWIDGWRKMTKVNTDDALAELISGVLYETVEEAALNAPAISKNENIALFFKNEGKNDATLFAILFDWKKALEAAKKENRDSYYIDRAIQPFVVGFVKINKTLGTESDVRTIALSAAEQGYGPLMYDVGLAMAYPNYLAADRGSVSAKAQKVWNYYFSKRTDVEKKPIFDLKTVRNINGHILPSSISGRESEYEDVANLDWRRNLLIRYFDGAEERLAHGDASVTDPWTGEQTTTKALKTELQRLETELAKRIAQDPLAFKYRMKGPSAKEGPALARLIQRGKDFKAQLLQLRKKGMHHHGDDAETDRWGTDTMYRAGENFFGKKYDEQFEEAAFSAPVLAKNSNLALIFRNGSESSERYAILFDWKKSWLTLQKTMPENPQFFGSFIKPFVVAYISTSDAGRLAGKASDFIDLSNVQTVNLAAAEQGHGPIMYDIAIAMAYPNYLCSDRVSSTKEATAVWQYYFNKRTDVEKVLIADPRTVPAKYFKGIGLPALSLGQDTAQTLITNKGNLEDQIRDEEAFLAYGEQTLPPGVHDRLKAELQQVNEELWKLMQNNPLAYKYRMKGPSAKEGPALAKLIQRGKDFKEKVKDQLETVQQSLARRSGVPPDELTDRNIERAGVNFFSDKYGQHNEE